MQDAAPLARYVKRNLMMSNALSNDELSQKISLAKRGICCLCSSRRNTKKIVWTR